MEKANSISKLLRTKSDQLAETVAAAMAAMKSSGSSEAAGVPESGGTLSRKSSKGLLAASPGGASGSSKNAHIRKSRSAAQMKLDFDDVSSGAALSRASSASLGFSYSFTGFTVPPDEIADLRSFSDDDIPEDLEAGMRKKTIQAEPTMPIYLKERKETLI